MARAPKNPGKETPSPSTGRGGTGAFANAVRQVSQKTTAAKSAAAGQGSTGSADVSGSGSTFDAPKSHMQNIGGGASIKANHGRER